MMRVIRRRRAVGHKSTCAHRSGYTHRGLLKDLLAALFLAVLAAAVLQSLINDRRRAAELEDPEKLAALSHEEYLIEAVRFGWPVRYMGGGHFRRPLNPPQDVGQTSQSPSSGAPAEETFTGTDDGGGG
jgi:hypothetical protein